MKNTNSDQKKVIHVIENCLFFKFIIQINQVKFNYFLIMTLSCFPEDYFFLGQDFDFDYQTKPSSQIISQVVGNLAESWKTNDSMFSISISRFYRCI